MRYRIQGFQASMCKVGTGLCCVAYLIIVGENTMKAVTWIGVDIAKKSFVAAQRTFEGFQTEPFALDPKGLKAFANWLPDEPQLQIVLEATGPYWRAFTEGLNSVAPQIAIAVVNPRRVRDFAKASPHASKTDVLDAQVLVHFAETFTPDVLNPSGDRACRQLRALTRHALQLAQQRDQVRDQHEKVAADPDTPKFVLRSLKQHQKHLDQALKRCWAQARESLHRDPHLQESFRLMLSIPGIGDKTALTLISEYGASLGQTGPKQLTRYAGLDIVFFLSGTSVYRLPHISKQGNWRIRRALYMAALSAIRHNPAVRSYYLKLVAKGRPKKSALVAAMRKLLHQCYGVLKNQIPFDPAYA